MQPSGRKYVITNPLTHHPSLVGLPLYVVTTTLLFDKSSTSHYNDPHKIALPLNQLEHYEAIITILTEKKGKRKDCIE